ncbi:MAG: hypothetical protein FJ086_14660 [Deltaproteobacteria bacterium]|nr:hypothetical protein [Deltaproteobacteria bacterium]
MNRYLLGWMLLGALPAAASSSFPTAVKEHVQLSQMPACALCHTGGVTGMGTVNTAFGKALRNEGLTAGDDDALRTALDALAAKGTDSDADGSGDVDELKAGRNPNLADAPGVDAGPDAGTTPQPPSPKYGCGANAVPGLGGLVALMVVAGWSRRRR